MQPGASRTEVTGPHGGRLKVRLAGAAIDGKANALLIELLGELFSVPLRNVTIVRGSTQRHKTIQIQNPGARMPALIAAWEQSAKESSP
ncbi:MAG: DUF167 domain-containing protein [Burkholderiales bacterium]|nr:DUF167 domain-containing protein [Burkholderiales bacterium]